jgi:hypothetical protein
MIFKGKLKWQYLVNFQCFDELSEGYKETSAVKIETSNQIWFSHIGRRMYHNILSCDIQELTELLNLVMISISTNKVDGDDEYTGKWIIWSGTSVSRTF